MPHTSHINRSCWRELNSEAKLATKMFPSKWWRSLALFLYGVEFPDCLTCISCFSSSQYISLFYVAPTAWVMLVFIRKIPLHSPWISGTILGLTIVCEEASEEEGHEYYPPSINYMYKKSVVTPSFFVAWHYIPTSNGICKDHMIFMANLCTSNAKWFGLVKKGC